MPRWRRFQCQGSYTHQPPTFPFAVRMTATGFGTGIDKENGQNEVWLPLWNRSSSYSELRAPPL